MDIRKMNTRYVCSKDRLDAIDFNIIRDYQFKKGMTWTIIMTNVNIKKMFNKINI